ncbi:hypothetical protein QBC46DRAFT_391306 [Diplogelasinospora grovesii]|uniref:Uncharacterized protein n=1 Tax=Diplogelasinospora grovesii TaxID=303347 RepID=A0AAN6S2V2_9PEZI|nr:hypothetical protein QBC46DRAFT_391306 [Diplogelasinospora grovesii]
MAPTWSRTLLFPEPSLRTTPMWDRPSTRSPIFIEPIVASTQMWSRPSNESPIFVDATVSAVPMWDRPTTMVPLCPCCSSSSSTPTIQDLRTTIRDRPSTSSARSHKTIRSMPSSLGLRLKKSFRNLRTRASSQSFSSDFWLCYYCI